MTGDNPQDESGQFKKGVEYPTDIDSFVPVQQPQQPNEPPQPAQNQAPNE